MADYDCGHIRCCDERDDPLHDHFLSPEQCPSCSRPEYALEADPGRCTASFPTFENYEDAIQAALQPALQRPSLAAPRVLVRSGGSPWRVAASDD